MQKCRGFLLLNNLNQSLFKSLLSILLILFLCFKPTKVIRISDKNRAIAFLKQGNYFFKSGKFNEAIENYDKALEINSGFQEAHRNREKAFKKL